MGHRTARMRLGVFVVAAATAGAGSPIAQVPSRRIVREAPGPPPGTEMTREYVQMVGRLAYLWGYALVSSHNRRAAFAMAPAPGLVGGVFPMAPVGRIAMLSDVADPEQTLVACPNQDVVDGGGYFALDGEPIIFQVPDFGDRFWVYALYDARTDEFSEIGKPYGTKPGFYMLVGPTWRGQTPAGVAAIVQSSTELAMAAPRVFKEDSAEDTRAVQSALGQVMFYPLSQFDGKMKTTDWTRLPTFPAQAGGKGEIPWVVPEKYFDRLPSIMALVPPLPGEEALYAWIKSVWDAAGKNPETKLALIESFVTAERELVGPLVQWRYNGRAAGNGWYSQVNNARWGTDYLNRTVTAKSNMYGNLPEEAKSLYRDLDSQGQPLNGQYGYAVTFPMGQLPPVKGFWSLTLYNERHFFHPNAWHRYSLGTKSKSLKYDADGSLTLYFGAKTPGKDKETNWVPAPEGAFSLYLRCYWPDQPILDGSWRPPNVERTR